MLEKAAQKFFEPHYVQRRRSLRGSHRVQLDREAGLGLRYDQWFDFFGMVFHLPDDHGLLHVDERHSVGPLLRGLATLRDLRMVFPNPFEDPDSMGYYQVPECADSI